MKQPKQPSPNIQIGKLTISRKLLILLCAVIVAVPILFYLYNYSFLSPRNYAQEVAQPIEDALVKAGAVKQCSSGDNGRGVDNDKPNYAGWYILTASKDEATKLIKRVGDENGYALVHQSSPYDYIDWYSDSSNKSSGTVSINLYSGGDKLSCPGGKSTLKIDERHMGITLNVSLPSHQ